MTPMSSRQHSLWRMSRAERAETEVVLVVLAAVCMIVALWLVTNWHSYTTPFLF